MNRIRSLRHTVIVRAISVVMAIAVASTMAMVIAMAVAMASGWDEVIKVEAISW